MSVEKKIIIICNPGSNSRKYEIREIDENTKDYKKLMFVLCDPGAGDPHCTAQFGKKEKRYAGDFFKKLDDAPNALKYILDKSLKKYNVSCAIFRIVAPGSYFSQNHIIDNECMDELEKVSRKAPLHVPVVMSEIKAFREAFPNATMAAISDSRFHNSRPDSNSFYAIGLELSIQDDIKKFGAHGLSMQSISRQLKNHYSFSNPPERIVVCHIGSGVSVTALKDLRSFDTTMGYTPLQGTVMGSRCGNIDPAAVFAIKRALHLSDTETLNYLNSCCGLLGIGGSKDFRDIESNLEDSRCYLAYNMFVSSIQKAIWEMAGSLGGIDALVLTATISERNAKFRKNLVSGFGGNPGLKDLGIEIYDRLNDDYDYREGPSNISINAKPVFVIPTDETAEMLREAETLFTSV